MIRRIACSGACRGRRLEAEDAPRLDPGRERPARPDDGRHAAARPRRSRTCRPPARRAGRRSTSRRGGASTCRSSAARSTTCSRRSTSPTRRCSNGDRAATTVASQALFMMNSPLVEVSCRAPGRDRSSADRASPMRDRLERACRRLFGRPADGGRARRAGRRSSSDIRTAPSTGAETPERAPAPGLAGALPGAAVVERVRLRRVTMPRGPELDDETPLIDVRRTTAVATAMPGADGRRASAASPWRRCWPRRRRPRRRQPARAAAAALPAEGEAGHLPVHVRRAVAPGHVRPQAAAGARQRASRCRRRSGRGSSRFRIGWATSSARRSSFASTARAGRWISSLFPAPGPRSTTSASSTRCTAPTRGTAGPCWSGTPAATRSSGRAWGRGSPTGSAARTRTSRATSRSARTSRRAARTTSARRFLPAAYQGTTLGTPAMKPRGREDPVHRRRHGPRDLQRLELDLIAEMDRRQRPAPRARQRAGRADRVVRAGLPACRPRRPRCSTICRANRRRRSELYGLDDPATADFGTAVPAGAAALGAGRPVRPVQPRRLGRSTTTSRPITAGSPAPIDKPIAGLLTDLKQRGLLDDTLVIWGGEFGRTPTCEGTDGRDHNPHGFTMWLAGGGVKAGTRLGQDRRLRLLRRRGQGARPRPARDDPAPAGPRPQAADLPLRRPRLPPDRRPRRSVEGILA